MLSLSRSLKKEDDKDRDGMNKQAHLYSRCIHFELDPDLQLSSVVCLALARFALQWIPPGDIDVVNKELSDTYIILACLFVYTWTWVCRDGRSC